MKLQISSRTRTAVWRMTSLWSRHKRCFELGFVKKQDRPQSWQGVVCADYWKKIKLESHRLDLKKYIDPCISCYKAAIHWNRIFPGGFCSCLFTYCFFNPIINIEIVNCHFRGLINCIYQFFTLYDLCGYNTVSLAFDLRTWFY